MRRTVAASLAWLLILLSLGMTSHPTSASSPSVVFVGGTGAGNYSTIHEALAAVSTGGSIIVYPGVYQEQLVINKSVDVRGSGQNMTVINGSRQGDVVIVAADDVTIRNLTIQGGGLQFPDTGLLIRGNRTHVLQVTSTENFYGAILWWGSSASVFEGNHIFKNHRCGIYFPHSSGNLIQGNVIADNPINGCGLYEGSNHNWILNNTFARNGFCGVNIRDSSDTHLSGNHFEANTIGVHLPPPLFGTVMGQNEFVGNTQDVQDELDAFVVSGLAFVGFVVLVLMWLWRRV